MHGPDVNVYTVHTQVLLECLVAHPRHPRDGAGDCAKFIFSVTMWVAKGETVEVFGQNQRIVVINGTFDENSTK